MIRINVQVETTGQHLPDFVGREAQIGRADAGDRALCRQSYQWAAQQRAPGHDEMRVLRQVTQQMIEQVADPGFVADRMPIVKHEDEVFWHVGNHVGHQSRSRGMGGRYTMVN